jgi:uncharacterized protein YraI
MGSKTTMESNPYEASNPVQLANLIDKDKDTWEAGREQLYNGSILVWLQAAGYKKIVDLWTGVADKFQDNKDAGLEAFLQLMKPGLQTPQLEVIPKKINILGIQPGQIRDVEVKISNKGRGHITGNVELSPAITGVSFSPDTININEKYDKNTSIYLSINTTDALKGAAKLRINSNAGAVEVPVSYRCALPLVLLFPWLGAMGGFFAYYFLSPLYMSKLFQFTGYYETLSSFAIGLLLALAMPAAIIIICREKTYRLLIPNLISALIAMVLLTNNILPDIGNGFLFYVVMLTAVCFILTSSFLNGLPFTAVFGAYGTRWLFMRGMLPTNLPQLSEKVIYLNEVWVPTVIFAFIGYGLGQWLLDRQKLPYLQKLAQALHYTGVILITVFLAASAFYSYNQSFAGNWLSLRGSAEIAKQATVYMGPSTSAEQIRTLSAGDNVKIINKEGQWLKIEFINNGYIHKSQLKVENSQAVVLSDSGSNLRSDPAIKPDNIITVVPKDKTVSIVSKDGDWCKVSYPDTGYILQTLVK